MGIIGVVKNMEFKFILCDNDYNLIVYYRNR